MFVIDSWLCIVIMYSYYILLFSMSNLFFLAMVCYQLLVNVNLIEDILSDN